jgi:hypothetical protein
MRPVKIKKWIPAEYPEGTNSANQDRPGHYMISGTGQYSSEFTEDALFHKWTIGTFPIEGAMGNVVEAIIELPDGTVNVVSHRDIKFMSEISEFKPPADKFELFKIEAYQEWLKLQSIADPQERDAALKKYAVVYIEQWKKYVSKIVE